MTVAAEGSPPLRVAGSRRSSLLQSEAVQGFALISPTFVYALVLLVLPILVVIAGLDDLVCLDLALSRHIRLASSGCTIFSNP